MTDDIEVYNNVLMADATLTFATATDVDMDSLTAAASTDISAITTGEGMYGTITAGSAEGLEDTIQTVDDPDYAILTLPEGEWLVSSSGSA